MSINESPRTRFRTVNQNYYNPEVGSGVSFVLAVTKKGPFNKPDEIFSTPARFNEVYGGEIVPDGTTSNIIRALGAGSKLRICRVAPMNPDGTVAGNKGTLTLGKLNSGVVEEVTSNRPDKYDQVIILKMDTGSTTPYLIGFGLKTKNYGGDVNSLDDGKYSALLKNNGSFLNLDTYQTNIVASYDPAKNRVESMAMLNYRSKQVVNSNYTVPSSFDLATFENFVNNSMYDVDILDFTSLTLPLDSGDAPSKMTLAQFKGIIKNDINKNPGVTFSFLNPTNVVLDASAGIYMYGMEGNIENTLLDEKSFIGDESKNSGIYSFADYSESYEMVASHVGQHLSWDATKLGKFYNALLNYTNRTESLVGWVELPKYKVGSEQEPSDYLSHIAFLNSLQLPYTAYGAVFTGGWVISDEDGDSQPSDTLGTCMAIGASLSNPWDSMAGMNNGIVGDATGIVSRNYGSDSNYEYLNILAQNSINTSVMKKQTSGTSVPVLWHNFSMLNDSSSMRFLSNVKTILYLKKNLKPIFDSYLEEPNTFSTWQSIYYDCLDVLTPMVDKNALFKFEYIGDQFAKTLADLTLNNEADVRAGKYKVKIKVWDVVKLQLIEVDIIIEKATKSVSLSISNAS